MFKNYLITIRKIKIALKLNKPEYIGMCILDLDKVLMYKFYYDYIKNKYVKKSRLLFEDTDGLMYEILVITQLYQNIIIIQTNYLLAEWKIDLVILLSNNVLD